MLYKIDPASKDILHFKGKSTFHALGWLEKDLENLIARNIETLTGQDLMVIFQERAWQSEPDILAVDENGNTWIFELKRWSADANAVLQILRYAQEFGQHSYEKLADYYAKQKTKTSPASGPFSLDVDHQRYFELASPVPKADFNRNHTLVIVSEGIADDCASAVEFWGKKGVDLRHFPVHVYEPDTGNAFLEFPNGQALGEGIWLLNTNRKGGQVDEDALMQGQKAAAFCDPWKYKILKMKKGDRVFFYSNGQGIIATGIVENGRIQKVAHGGVDDDEYFVKLVEFKEPRVPLTAAMIHDKILGHNLNYRQVLVSLLKNDCDLLLQNF